MNHSPSAVSQQPSDEDPKLFREGVKAVWPTLFGMAAWGMVVGVAMVKTHLTVPQAFGMTLLVFAGTAQLASLPLIAAQASVWVIFATALVVNLRFVIFSALLAPHFAHLPWYKRIFFSYIGGDMTVAMFLQRFPDQTEAPGKLAYLKGLVYPSWIAWQAGSILGILLASSVPPEWGLGFAGTLAIICIAVPLLATRPALCGAAVAGVVSIVAAQWPYKLGVLAAVVTGMLAAIGIQEWQERREA